MADAARQRYRQTPGGIDFSEQHVRDGMSSLLTRIENLEDCRHMIFQPWNREWAAVQQYYNYRFARLADFFDQIFLYSWDIQCRAVVAFAYGCQILLLGFVAYDAANASDLLATAPTALPAPRPPADRLAPLRGRGASRRST